MAEYTITLPDGTCVEGDDHINVVHMAQILRKTDDEDDSGFTVPYGGHEITLSGDEDEGDDITVEYGGSNTYDEDEDSKTLQERVDEAYANGRVSFETDDEADDEDVRESIESLRRALGRDRPR